MSFLASEIYSNKQCDEWSKNHIFNSTEFHLKNQLFPFVRIDSLEELKLSINSCNKIEMTRSSVLKIFINKKVLFENNLNINNLLKLFSPKRMILFLNINGFNQRQVETQLSWINFREEYNFVNVNFDFYQNESLVTVEKCKRENFDRNIRNFFGDIKFLSLNDKIFYKGQICPYVFMNVKLSHMRLMEISNSLLFMNRLEFIDLNETESFDFKTNSLELLEMNFAYEILSEKNMNKFVFQL